MIEADRADRVEARAGRTCTARSCRARRRRRAASGRCSADQRLPDELGDQLEVALAVLVRGDRRAGSRAGWRGRWSRSARGRAAGTARRSSRRRSRARRRRAARRRKRTPRGIDRDLLRLDLDAGPARSRGAAAPAAGRSAARRRRRRRSGRSSSGWRRRCGSPHPACAAGPPLPAIVTSPSTKSVGSVGIGSGSQRSWFGVAAVASKSLVEQAVVDALERLVHARPAGCGRARCAGSRARGAVNAVPEICSAYRPYGHALRRVLPDRQRAGQRLGGELVREARTGTRGRRTPARSCRLAFGLDGRGHRGLLGAPRAHAGGVRAGDVSRHRDLTVRWYSRSSRSATARRVGPGLGGRDRGAVRAAARVQAAPRFRARGRSEEGRRGRR